MSHRRNTSGRGKKPAGAVLASMEKAVEEQVTTVAETVAEVAVAAEQAVAPVEAPVAPEPIVAEPIAQPEVQIVNTIAPAASTAEPAQKGTREAMNQINEQIQQQTQAATEQFRSAFGDMSERTRSAMEKSTKIAEDMADLTRGNVEAVLASTKAAARGVETLAQETADYSRRSFEEASNTMKSFAEVRSAADLFKLQSDYARSAFEAYVAESAKVSEHMLKLAGEVAEPITSRYAVAADRAKAMVA